MSSKVITPQQIQQATIRLKCGDEEGSAFFISDTLVLTARHVIIDAIDENEKIYAILPNLGAKSEPIICNLLGHGGEGLDIALIEVPIQISPFPLPLFRGQVRYNAHWETFGFPFSHQISGNRYLGSVRKTNIDKPYDIELTSDSIDNKLDYSGLSGSPLVIENEVYGVITYNITDGFGAISILKIAEFLDLYKIPYRVQKDLEDLPDNFNDLDSIVPNEQTLALLDNQLVRGGKFYIIHGPPGSGKTLICATYQFNNQNSEVAGRYFIRLPLDQRPISYRVSKEAFLEWIEDLISQKLSGSFYPKQSVSWDQRVRNFHSLLIALNDYYTKKNQTGFIFLDGLDDINEFSPNSLVEFLGILPESLPDHLSFVFSIIRKNILPSNVQALISPEDEIKVRPLEIDQCSYFLQEKLKSIEPNINILILQKLAEKSEGHPLYLRYISELIKNKQPEDFENWIDQLPKIDGEIERYYEKIWQTNFATDQEKFWIALIVSQLRQPIPIDTLLQILPESSRLAFVSKFPTILHLFKVSDKADIYHSSFRLFIEHKSEYLLPSAHDYIVNYCNKADTDTYSITNIVYHTLHSSQPLLAVDFCDQEWADACAKISVEPELVLNDIVSVESFCLEAGNFTEFVRIKLLIQRIRFRYDNVLAANASSIARVLLAMGNPSYALKYIVRFSNLIISDEESIWFLMKFNQIGAYEEFKILLRAIQSRYRALIELANNENYFPFRVYNLLAKSTTINLANNPTESAKKVMGLLQNLKKVADLPENNGSNADQINNFRQELGAFFSGFVTYHRNQYTKSAIIFRKQMPHIPAAEWAGGFAHTALAFNKIVESEISNHKITYDLIVEDIEYAIDNYGYLQKDALFIYAAILEESKRPEIVKKLIAEVYQSNPSENLREENGVDANISEMHSIINFQEGLGYLDEISAYPHLRNFINKEWENAILDRIKLIGFCFGKAWRLRAEGKISEVNEISPYISKILEDFQFSLRERSQWERSYSIPEQIFPHIYYKLTRFYLEFVPDELEGFISLILNNPNSQLGLYTEGYRAALSNIALGLSKSESFGKFTVSVLKNLEEHVLIATQNRWERVPALLEISKMYANLGNNEKAMKVYQQMLDTSMGPTWYKEDQFSLINTSLSLPKVGNDNPLFQDFSKQLEFASGELTFQRYVRVAQQELVGNMSSQGNIASAISYYKYQTLPEPVQVIANAESSTIDSINPGDGYKLGAQNIVEARGIINLLKSCDGDPVIIWAFTEVFYINDDIYRYIDQFAELQATCIKRVITDHPSVELEFFRERLATCITDSKLDGNRHHYLKDLLEYLPKQEYDFLVDLLKESDISFPKPSPPPVKERSPEEDAHMDSLNFPGLGKQANYRKLPDMLSKANKQLEMENKSKASEIIAEALLLLHQGKSDIWMGSSLGKDVGELWKLLSQAASIPEILKLIKEPISEHYTQDWNVVDKLLRSLKNQINAEQTAQILETIKEHIHLMIRDPEKIEGFNWKFMPDDLERSIDDQLLDLLIWLLDHPYISVKKRVIESLIMICELRPVVISRLTLWIISLDNSVAREICAYILYHLSERHPELLLKEINFNSELKVKMIQEEHFMIRYYLLKMVDNLKKQNPSMEEFHQNLILSFDEIISQGADVYFEEPYIHLINPIIDSFMELNVLNGAFCKEFLLKIDKISEPLSIFDQIRAGHYVERSYFENEVHYRRAVHILRQAFNLTIPSRVTRNNIETAAAILKLHYLHEN